MSRHMRWLLVGICLWVCPAVTSSVAEPASAQTGLASPANQFSADASDDASTRPSALPLERSEGDAARNAEPAKPNWRYNVWHFVTPSSPFFKEDRSALHSAGVIQDDGRFALMVLGTPDQGALVSVNVPGSEPQSVLTSDLVLVSGSVLSRRITQEQLVANATLDGASHTYSFRIAPADVEMFMAALEWRITAGEQSVSLTLKGSRKAISKAIAERDASLKTSSADAQD